MAGTPIRRARREARVQEEVARRMAELNGQPPPVFAAPPPTEEFPPELRAAPIMVPPRRAIVPSVRIADPPAAPPLSEAEAEMFTRARTLSLKYLLEFLESPIEDYTPGADKLKLKRVEVAQAVLSLGGRIDPSVLRGQATDEVGEMLAQVRAESGPLAEPQRPE